MLYPALIQALLHADVYPDSTTSVELVETHISWVLLTDKFVYKIKKPVDFGFLDFSNLPLRRHYCEEELRLNRRLAPQLYLEVVPLRGSPEKPLFNGPDPTIEYAVKMRRFDPASTFDHLAEDARLKAIHIDRLAETVANFHHRLSGKGDSAAAQTLPSIHARALRNFETIEGFVKDNALHDTVLHLREWTEHSFSKQTPLMQKRAESGFIRECHGDLHLGNIALIDEQPVPFDCIEFNEEMRWIDVIDEVAFTVTDLHAHRLPDYASRYLNRYLEISGDFQGLGLLAFYRVYRALVRAKVALLSRVPPGNDPTHNLALETQYRNYVSTARACIDQTSPVLMITHGLSGCGKSTIAARIAEKMPAIQLRSDVERKRLAQNDASLLNRLYSDETTRITYQHLAETAETLIDFGYSVIIDATFLQKRWRDRFRQLAVQKGIPFRILDIRAPLEALQDRITRRLKAHDDPSDANLDVLKLQQKQQEPLSLGEQEVSTVVPSKEEPDIATLIARLRA